ncbi:MAG: aconitate hydratase [Deltaproteobacteria bacterium]|nr:aconitate hydratase [Deltaproteobacteria bacterium]
MSRNTIFHKILQDHGVDPPAAGEPLALPVDQTLTQDATGTMACLQFEALGLPRVRTRLSVSYVDHNTLGTTPANFEDHRYLRTMASRYGIVFSPPGNGICHQVHLERFGVPGRTLLGSDSHTPTAGGIGMAAMGAGGLDVAMAMAGEPFSLSMPKIVLVRLSGNLSPWVTAKDVILEILRRETVKGGVGCVYEYGGEGVSTLTVPQRATITNMGAELGATTSIFPSDENTRAFMAAQGREDDWTPLSPGADAEYDRVIDIDLSALEPLVAKPHMPDQVAPVSELAGKPVDQVVIGSCTNSSFRDLATVAAALSGRAVCPSTQLVIAPGSRQVLSMLAKSGALSDLLSAGARILECACGPCIGVGQAPPSGGVTLRTVNRNFKGRSGTPDAGVYLCSPETAAAAALTGVFTDPRELGDYPDIPMPQTFAVDDSLFILPCGPGEKPEVIMGPNIKPLPKGKPLSGDLTGTVLLKLSDNITTDDIMPAGAKILSLRSNVPAISEYVFSGIDPEFSKRAKHHGGGIVVAGENYGQGSSREHAALAPMHLGVRAVAARSFARIHRANLVNFGILPLIFDNGADLDNISQGDILTLPDARETILTRDRFSLKNQTTGTDIPVHIDLSPAEREVAAAGGRLAWYRENKK